jgi:hypothetical protein
MRTTLAVAALLAALLAGTAEAKVRWFHSPSGNIQCQVSKADGTYKTEAFCQTFDPPRTVTLHRSGKSTRCGSSCVGNGPEDAFTLEYGHSVRVGPFKCTSRTWGMRCVVRSNGHGFTISHQAIRTF